jgi:hypothetical protein
MGRNAAAGVRGWRKMAYPKCPHPKCEARFFEVGEVLPDGRQDPVQVLQCSRCGAVLGVLENLAPVQRELAILRSLLEKPQ